MSTAEGPDDLTRKQRREAAREERKALEAAQTAKAARQRRLIGLVAALAAAAAIVVVAIVISSSSSGTKTETGLAHTPSTVVAPITALIGDIPQSGTTLGNHNAPVTMDYYGDLECPICQEFSLQTLPTVITDLVKSGKMKITYRSLQTATQDPTVFQQQQVAAYAAGQQNKGWYYIELFYHEQGKEDSGYVNTAYLDNLAQQVPGLDLASWQSAQNDPALASQVKADEAKASSLGFNSTPTLVLTGPNGTKGTVGFVPYSTIQQLYQSVA